MRVKITQLHKQLKTEGQNATMIYVTHDQVEARQWEIESVF